MGQTNGQPKPEDEEPSRGLEWPRCGCAHLPVLYARQRAKRIVRVP